MDKPLGRRAIYEIIDDIAVLDEDRVFASIPEFDDLSLGYTDITYSQLAVAIDRVAWWLQNELHGHPRLSTFAYLGPNDLRYPLFIVAAMKTSYKVLLPSLRNSPLVQTSLLDKTSCEVVLYDGTTRNIQSCFDKSDHLQFIQVPDLNTILSDTSPSNPYLVHDDDLNEETLSRPFMVLHSSGSTGNPKPITYSLASVVTEETHRILDQHNGELWYRELEESRCYVCLPGFHSAGVWFQLILPILFNYTVVWGPAGTPLNSDIAAQVLQSGSARANGAIFSVSILKSLFESQPSTLFTQMDFAFSAGSPLSAPVGDKLSKLTRLHNFIGYSEAAAPPRYLLGPDEWQYHHFHPASGFHPEPLDDGSDLHELVIRRVPDQNPPAQPVFLIYPELEEYRTKDLVSKHPTKPHLWLHRGRLDDLIVLSNGEKVDPAATEAFMQTDSSVEKALVYGNGQPCCSLLIELRANAHATEAMEGIWETVRRANANVPGHAQISRDKILLAAKNKPFLRAGKGSVQRQMTFSEYRKELEALYALEELVDFTNTLDPIFPTVDVLDGIISTVCGITHLNPDDNFFNAGMDSRQVAELVRHIHKTCFPQQRDAKYLGARIVYNNPTMAKLSMQLQSLIQSTTPNGVEHKATEADIPDFNAIVHSFASTQPANTNGYTVVLTGSTGSLGSPILKELLQLSSVTAVYCLVRSRDKALAKFNKQSFTTRSDKLRVLEVSLADPGLGLHPVQYRDLTESTDIIIHCAWNVNFNLSLENYMASDICGVNNLISFSLRSRKRPRIVFTSSVAAVANWNASHASTSVPESIIVDSTVPGPSGYGQSKYIAEHLLAKAAEQHRIPVTIFRIGQIAGSIAEDGPVWNSQEWLPTLIKASKQLGILPSELGAGNMVDWVPVDVLASAVVEAACSWLRDPYPSAAALVYHGANPLPVPWSDFLPALKGVLGQETKTMPYANWLLELKKLAQDESANAWTTLLEWFEEFGEQAYPVLSLASTVAANKVMRNMGPITSTAMLSWVKRWEL